MAIRIVVAGDIFIDQVLSGFSEWPQPGEEVVVASMIRELGGGAPHTAAGLARLGWDVSLAGPFGSADGPWVRERLAQLGLKGGDLREVQGEPTGTTIAISSPEDRIFFTCMGANRFLYDALTALPSGTHLHLACPCEAALLRQLSTQFATVSIDAGWRPDWLRNPDVLNALRAITWFLPNQREAALMTGETTAESILHSLHELGIKTALKLGPQGSALRQENGTILMVPSIAVHAVDTTGAGDNFNAGFLDAWLRAKSPGECLRAGNVFGALSTRAMGGMNGFPTLEELQTWVSK